MFDISQMITTYGPWAIFALVLIEDFGVPPVPGETVLITAAVLASRGKLPIEWLLPAAWLGAVLGDNIGYAIGRYAGRRVVLRFGGRVGITEARLSWVERFFARYGGAIVIVARFFVGLRQLMALLPVSAVWRRPRLCSVTHSGQRYGLWSGVLVSTGLAVISRYCCTRWDQPLPVLSSSWA